MVDSVRVTPPGFRLLDDNGDPIAGGYLKIFDTGTSNVRAFSTDGDLSDSVTQLTADSSGVLQSGGADVCAYTNTSDYKAVFYDASDNVVMTFDGQAGALDTSGFLTAATAWTVGTSAKTSDYTVLDADIGTVLNCDASSGAITVTLGNGSSGNAAIVGDGATVIVRKKDTSANVVAVVGYSAENIDGASTFNLTEANDSIMLVADGANWFSMAKGNESGANDILATDATYRTVSATCVVDNTLPQSSEGDAIDTVAIVPSTGTSQIKIYWNFWGVPSADMDAVVSVFTDSETDATYAEVVSFNTGDYAQVAGFFVDSPATTSSVTYTLRMGVTTGTFDINGSTSAILLGGAATTTLIAEEF